MGDSKQTMNDNAGTQGNDSGSTTSQPSASGESSTKPNSLPEPASSSQSDSVGDVQEPPHTQSPKIPVDDHASGHTASQSKDGPNPYRNHSQPRMPDPGP